MKNLNCLAHRKVLNYQNQHIRILYTERVVWNTWVIFPHLNNFKKLPKFVKYKALISSDRASIGVKARRALKRHHTQRRRRSIVSDTASCEGPLKWAQAKDIIHRNCASLKSFFKSSFQWGRNRIQVKHRSVKYWDGQRQFAKYSSSLRINIIY